MRRERDIHHPTDHRRVASINIGVVTAPWGIFYLRLFLFTNEGTAAGSYVRIHPGPNSASRMDRYVEGTRSTSGRRCSGPVICLDGFVCCEAVPGGSFVTIPRLRVQRTTGPPLSSLVTIVSFSLVAPSGILILEYPIGIDA
jgi:hypothetical protein